MVIVTEMAQDNFKTLIGKIKTLKLLVSRRFQGSEPIGHPRFDMREAVIALRDNRAEPDGTDPAHTESVPVAMGGKMLINQRRQLHALHLLKQQGNIVDALGENMLDIIHPHSLAQSSI